MPLITVHHYSTHLPALVGCVSHTDGRVLELGAGVYSTPILHCACAGRELVTADHNEEWIERFLFMASAEHQFELVDDWNTYHRLNEEWDVALVDQTPGRARAMSVEQLRGRCRFIVVHDTNDERFGYEPLLSSFKYRQDFTELGVAACTTVVSDICPLPFSLADPTSGHAEVRLASDPIDLQVAPAGWARHVIPCPRSAQRHFFLAGTAHVEDQANIDLQILFCDAADRLLWWVDVNRWRRLGRDGGFCIPRDAAAPVAPQAGGVEHPSWVDVEKMMVRARATSATTVRLAELRLLSQAPVAQDAA